MAKVRILAFDGGYRPLVMCLLLARLERARPGLLESVSVLAGTSSGSATAAIIGVSEVAQTGLERAIEVFKLWQPLAEASPFSPRTIGATMGQNAFLTHEQLYRELIPVLGEARLNETKRKLVVPTVELDNHTPVDRLRHWSIQIYHNLAQEVSHNNRLLDVVLRSSSIPLMHPAYQGHADGGLFANNPAMSAVIAARDFLSVDLSDIVVLSMGQGVTNHFVDLEHGDVGYKKWLFDPENPMAFLNLVLDLNRQATVYQLSRLLDERFIRFNPVLSADAQPSPDISAEQFAFEQQLVAQEPEIDLILHHLDSIGWFDDD